MDYKDALFKLINLYGLEILRDRFFSRSLISDYIGASLDDNQLLEAYSLLNKDQYIYEIIQKQEMVDSKAAIKSIIAKQSKKYTVRQYIKSIEPIYMVVFPKDYVPLKEPSKISNPPFSKVHKGTRVQVGNQPPLVGAVINKAPVNKKKNDYHSIYLTIEDCSVSINFTNKKRLSITQGDKRVTSKVRHVYKQDAVFIHLKKDRLDYTINLPFKYYDIIDIFHSEGNLYLNCDERMRYLAKKGNINFGDGLLSISTNIAELNINQKRGYFIQNCKFNKLNMKGDNVEVYSYFIAGVQKEVAISVQKGIIDIRSRDYKIRPKVNHLFHVVKNVNGIYRLGSNKLLLQLSVQKGKIKVH